MTLDKWLRPGILAAMVLAGCGDDDVPDGASIEVNAGSGLRTTEGGGTTTFTVRLTGIPTVPITVTVASSNTAEGIVAPRTIEFTEDNWDSGVTVTVIGVDDDIVDGDQRFKASVEAGRAGSEEVAVTNEDDDGPGARVTPTSGLVTTEAGGSASFTIALNTRPTASVTVPITSTSPSEGAVTPATLTFTVDNWNAPQIVTATGVDDAVADGPKAYTVRVGAASSPDAAYQGLDPADVSVTNIDDDSPGILVSPTAGLVTTEAGGSATFGVVLIAQPTANVTVALSSNDPGEGGPTPSTLIFTAANWNAPQNVTVTGEDDDSADGDQSYTIVVGPATSADAGYQGIDPADVVATNVDNDSPGVLVGPTAGLETSESGGAASFDVVLNSQPTADVTILVSSSAPDEGVASPATIVFTPANWSAPQSVTVTGADDPLDDGNQLYTIELAAVTSDDGGYQGIGPADVTVTNVDDEAPGFIVTPTSGLATSEDGGDATFTVALVSAPTATVTVEVASEAPTEGVATPASLTFTTADWFVPQTVTVTGVDDGVGDGDQPYRIRLAPATSGDPAYDGFDPPDVDATNVDNDSPGFTVTPSFGLLVSEFGDSDSFTVVLNAQPAEDVTITVKSQRTGEATVAPASLTFTAANWNVAQTVTVTGVDDAIVDGNQVFEIITGPATSADPGYSGRNPPNVHVTSFDNDSASVLVQAPALLSVSEAGQSTTFSMVLTVQPSANVTCAVSSSDTAEGTVSPSPLVFTPGNFDQPQTVTVTGVDDGVVDGTQLFFIVTAKCTSADPAYNHVNPRDLNARNTDDD